MNNEKIGHFICKLRTEKKWTQEDLANKLFVDRTMVSKWERGVYIPSTEVLLNMQSLFNVSINEILYGERKDKKNNEEIDSIPLSIIKEERRKKRKVIFISLFIIFILLFLLLGYYFVNNYNSIKVYKISGENEDFILSDGLLVFSKEKSYLRIGNLESKSNNNVSSISLYYLKDDKEKIIFSGGKTNLDILHINEFDYDELFEYNDLKYIINNLKLKIIINNNEEKTLDLNLVKDYENNKLFNRYTRPISDSGAIDSKINIPRYIKQNFNYDREMYEYIRYNNNVTEEYFLNVDVYLITIKSNDYEEKYFYYYSDDSISYYKFINDKQIDQYIYNFKKDLCEYGSCNNQAINDIKTKYLDLIIEK